MSAGLNDVPVDSVRQRIQRLVGLIETGTFGKSDVESLAPELRAALLLPDFAVYQQERLGGLLDGLSYSAGLHRTKSHVMFANDLADWLDAYSKKLTGSVQRTQRSLEEAETHRRFYSREYDRMVEIVKNLRAQRSAVRAFFSGDDNDDDA